MPYYKMLLNDMTERQPSIKVLLEQLNAQFESKDGIPKRDVLVKLRDDATREEADKIRYGLLQHVNDMTVYVNDKFTIDDTIKTMSAPADAFAVFISLMILTLAFFMMTVSFSQKIRDLSWEQGVLRSIGLTKTENNAIFYYEATTIVVASFVTGIVIGLLSVVLLAALFAQIVESPFSMVVPYAEISFILVICSVATILAVRIPAMALNSKQISSVLKGGGG